MYTNCTSSALQNILHDAKSILALVIRIIKIKGNDSLQFKARIAHHGNKDVEDDKLPSDCWMCSPIET